MQIKIAFLYSVSSACLNVWRCVTTSFSWLYVLLLCYHAFAIVVVVKNKKRMNEWMEYTIRLFIWFLIVLFILSYFSYFDRMYESKNQIYLLTITRNYLATFVTLLCYLTHFLKPFCITSTSVYIMHAAERSINLAENAWSNLTQNALFLWPCFANFFLC